MRLIFFPRNFRNRSRLRTKPVPATTDKHKLTQIEINNQSVFIRVHLWLILSFSKCRERLPIFLPEENQTVICTPALSRNKRTTLSFMQKHIRQKKNWWQKNELQQDLQSWSVFFCRPCFCETWPDFCKQSTGITPGIKLWMNLCDYLCSVVSIRG